MIVDCKERINQCLRDGIPVVYADESCLTTKLLRSHQWMVKRKNIEVDEKLLNTKTLAFVLAISKDKGLVACKTFERSLDQFDFIAFLKVLRKKYGDQRFALFIDNAGFHKAIKVNEYVADHNIEIILSPIYSPEYQPVESVIGLVKQCIKKKRLQNILQGKEQSYEKMLNEALKRVTSEYCIKVIKYCSNLINS